MDSGDCVTHTVPTYEDHALTHAFFRVDFAGRVLTESAIKIFTEQHHHEEEKTVRTVNRERETLWCVAVAFASELQSSAESSDEGCRSIRGHNTTREKHNTRTRATHC